MLTNFLTELTKDLRGKWLERLFGPAFLFWAGGLLLVIGPQGLDCLVAAICSPCPRWRRSAGWWRRCSS
jgi:hypothetical protein